ncbi:MAG: hypothetical protein P4M07_28250 [Xanthobacteraceae bacterium]|nr:hypothetical protein [Xanthobacteraceae bacterium]
MSLADVCRFNPTAGGTGDWTYSSTVQGYQSPALANVQNGLSYRLRAESADLSQWEISTGVYTSGTGTFARTTVLYNSAGTGSAPGQSGAGTPVNFSAAPQVAVIALAEDFRELLQAARTYYVATTGSDSNNGLSSAAPFLTIQHAINVVAGLDLGAGNNVTIQLAAGIYSGGVTVGSPFVGSGTVTILGSTSSPASCVVNNSSGSAVYVGGGARLSVSGITVTATSGHGMVAYGTGSTLTIAGACGFGAVSLSHLTAQVSANILVTANTSIAAAAQYHWDAETGGVIIDQAHTITITGTPAFSSAFAYANYGAMFVNANTFSGAATGPRYSSTANGLIQTFGSGASYLPGSTAGSTSNGGLYV